MKTVAILKHSQIAHVAFLGGVLAVFLDLNVGRFHEIPEEGKR